EVVSNAAVVDSYVHVSSRFGADQDSGDVVESTAFVGGVDQLLARLLEIAFAACDHAQNLFFGNHACQSIRTEQIDVARPRVDLGGIGNDLQRAAEGAGDDVAERMLFCFGLGEHSCLHLF